MSNSQNPSPMSKLSALRHGIGEILGFVVAALGAVLEILAGRWPEVAERRRKPARLEAAESRVESAAQYPVQEG
jgi:hypothetical protein